MKIYRYLLAASMASIPGLAFTATDGSLGDTSTGTSVINLIKETSVLISNVDDITFPITGGIVTTSSEAGDDVCVFSSTGLYSVTITSANGSTGATPSQQFELVDNTVNASIDYAITWGYWNQFRSCYARC